MAGWRFPSLSRDLAWIAVGALVVAGFVGAGIGAAADVLIHRHSTHRPARG